MLNALGEPKLVSTADIIANVIRTKNFMEAQEFSFKGNITR